jgi:RND family efflux transporter MFP subunit
MPKLRTLIIIGAPLLLVATVSLVILASGRKKGPAHAQAETAPITVQTVIISRQEYPVIDEAPGTVAAIRQADIAPKVMSHIDAIYVREGDHVVKGQLLARLEGKDIAVSVQQATAGLMNAEAAYEQTKTAYAIQRTQSTTGVRQAEAAVEQAKAQLAKVKQGPRPEQIRQAEEQEARAKAAYEQAAAHLDMAREGARSQQKRQAEQGVIVAKQQVAQAEAGVSAARANLTTVESDYTRVKNLYEQEILPKQRLDHMTAQLEAAKSAVRQAEAGVAAAKAGLEMAKAQASMVEEGARSQEITAADKQVAQAKAAYEQARQETLMARQGGRWEDITTAEAAVRQAEEAQRATRAAQARDQVSAKDITRAKAGVAQARAEVARAGTMLGYTNIYAPFDGVITARQADPGDMAMPQMPILSIDDHTQYQLVSRVPESIAARMTKGATVTVVLSALNQTVTARIAEIVPSADPATRTLTIKANLPRLAGLQSGLFGRMQIASGKEDRLMAPRTAVVERNGLTGVYTLVEGKARFTLVTLGKEAGDLVQILSGIADGRRIIAMPPAGLIEGAPVREEGAAR